MPDFPTIYPPPRMTTFSAQFSACQLACWHATPTLGAFTWPAANLAIYVPVSCPFMFQIVNMFWGNGATASGTVDVGFYSPDGGRVFSTGATTQTGTGVNQFQALSNVIDPGGGYFAMLCSSATATAWGIASGPSNADYRSAGLRQQAVGSATLPATATFAQYAQSVYPLIGIER